MTKPHCVAVSTKRHRVGSRGAIEINIFVNSALCTVVLSHPKNLNELRGFSGVSWTPWLPDLGST
eukprot:1763759-Amphidinium_carterae.1